MSDFQNNRSLVFRFIVEPFGKVYRELRRFFKRRIIGRDWNLKKRSERLPTISIMSAPAAASAVCGGDAPVVRFPESFETRYRKYPDRRPVLSESVSGLATKIRELMPQSRFVIALSHDNYLKVVGGVQLCVGEEQRACNQNQIGYVHCFPTNHRPALARPEEPFFVSINCNGKWVAECPGDFVMEVFEELVNGEAKKDLSDVILHQLLGWNMEWVFRLVEERGGGKALFWVHDYFALCPSAVLMRNDIAFCGVPPVESNACQVCIYGEERVRHLSAFHNLFNRFDITVVTCSAHVDWMWKEKADFRISRRLLNPHCHIEWENTRRADGNGSPASPLRVAFIGLGMYYKGWETWKQIVNRFGSDPRFDFFHFSVKNSSLPLKFVPVNVSPDNRLQMLEALKKHKIDVAFLWSVCSETFSFTLYEAMAAGCYVITNPLSGNIQHTVLETNCGTVLSSEEEAISWFESDKLTMAARKYLNEKARSGSLVFTSGSYKIIQDGIDRR